MWTFKGPFTGKVKDLDTNDVMEDVTMHVKYGRAVKIHANEDGFMTKVVVRDERKGLKWTYKKQS